MSDLISETGWIRKSIESELAKPIKNREIIALNDLFITSSAWEELKKGILTTLEDFHRKNPLVAGMNKEELRLRADVGMPVFDPLLALLAREKKIDIAGDLVRISGRGVAMKDEEAESKKTIEDAFATAGLKVPALHEVLAGLKVDKVRGQKIVTLLLRDKILIKVSDELVFHRDALDELRQLILAQKAKSPRIDVATFKEMTGVSRKYAIPLLEYLDRQRITQRVGDARLIL